MIFQESSQVRTIVGRLETGEECIEELTAFCQEHDIEAGEVRAVGRFDQVEVVSFDSESGGYKPVYEGEGKFDVLNLVGNIATVGDEVIVRLQAVLAAQGPLGSQVMTGELRSGRAVEFEFVLEAFEDLKIERRMNTQSGLPTIASIQRLETPEPADGSTEEANEADQANEPMKGKGMSWDDVESASDETAESQEDTGAEESEDPYGDMDLDSPMLEAGDILDHPKLGRCRVMRVEDDKYAHIRMRRGKIRKLSLDVVEVKFEGEENGRNIFKAQVGK
jgi:predicted DNA-binding protein with PD1-like motif